MCNPVAAWERSRAPDLLRVSRKRLLRLMREHALLSPHRARRRDEDSHERQIITTETNGVIERFFRTLKEQSIHGRVFQTIDEVRDAVRAFATRYNAEWLIEKNGYLSPLDARAARLDTSLRRAA